MERNASQPLELFYCYARKDRDLRDELDIHLAGLRRSGRITAWYDGEISPGTPWEHAIKTHLESAHIILLLVSPDFIHSDYCYSVEMTQAIKRHYANTARVIPVLLRPADWKGAPFSELQVLPSDARPVTSWLDRDVAFEDVVGGIRQVVEGLLQLNSTTSNAPPPEESRQSNVNSSRTENLEASPKPHSPTQAMSVPPSGERAFLDITRISNLSSLSDPDAVRMYQRALTAQIQGELVETIQILQEILNLYPNFRERELLSLQKAVLWQLAEQSARSGKWEEEIHALEELGKLPLKNYRRIEELLKIAQQNQSYAGVYDDAQQLLQGGFVATAAQRLAFVWNKARYYGDPAGLAKQVGIQAPDRVTKERDHFFFISHSPPRGLGTSPKAIWWSTFGFLVGLGSVIGILTQSWLWASGASVLVVSLLCILRPYRAITPIITICVFLISIIAICGIGWYSSTLNSNQSQLSHLWIIGDRTLWLSRQVYFGLALGVLLSALGDLVGLLVEATDPMDLILTIILDEWWISVALAVLLLIAWVVPAYFGWGFGLGFGWPFALSGCLIGCIGGLGLIYSVVIWSRYKRHLASRSRWA